MDMRICVVILTVVCCACASKYSEENNADRDSPFKMMKVNLIWQKARLRISDKPQLAALYQDLKNQDQLEADLKKRRAAGDDGDGEFEALVRRKFLDIITKYGLEAIHPDLEVDKKNLNEAAPKPDVQAKWEKVIQDKKLGKLWKKAQMSGFTERELGALRAEFLHHADKVEELNSLQADLKRDSLLSNSVGGLKDDGDQESLQQERERHVGLKTRYKELRDSINDLEERILKEKSLDESAAGGFRHPKVIDLWFAAKNGNFTEQELISIQEELNHFQHKLSKLEHLEMEHESLTEKLQDKKHQLGNYPEKQLKVQEKVKDYSRKMKKYEHDIRSRITARSHNEL